MALGSTTVCVMGCPDGQYVGASPLICDSCDANCYKCVNTATNCISCGLSGGGVQLYLLPNATCSNLCPSQHFPNTNNICLPCHSSCMSCNGTLAINCLTCDITAIQPLYYDSSNHTCTLVCSINYYTVIASIYLCDQCHISCFKCAIPHSPTACNTCN